MSPEWSASILELITKSKQRVSIMFSGRSYSLYTCMNLFEVLYWHSNSAWPITWWLGSSKSSYLCYLFRYTKKCHGCSRCPSRNSSPAVAQYNSISYKNPDRYWCFQAPSYLSRYQWVTVCMLHPQIWVTVIYHLQVNMISVLTYQPL